MRAALLLALFALGCTRPDLHFLSPDGRHTATVRNHFAIDPPSQSIWIDDTRILRLGDDQDWCNQVVWSPDGAIAGFLVQDAQLITVDVASKRILDRQWLVERDGYPTSRMACDLRIDDTGAASFTAKTR